MVFVVGFTVPSMRLPGFSQQAAHVTPTQPSLPEVLRYLIPICALEVRHMRKSWLCSSPVKRQLVRPEPSFPKHSICSAHISYLLGKK